MHIAARSYLSTGVALVGAGAIAISPVAPPLPDVEVPSMSTVSVALTANPLQTWVEVFTQAAENLSILGQQFADRPAPILQQLIENQLANIETLAPAFEEFAQGLLTALNPTNPDGIAANLGEAFQQIITGHPAEGFPAIFQAFLQPILFPSLALLVPVQGIITQSAQNILDVANQAITVVAVGAIGFLNPVFSGFNALGAATQAVVDAANVGDIAGVITAVLDIPGVVAGGVINGFGFDGGILTPMSGTIAALLTLRNTIADALKFDPPAPLTAQVSEASTEVGDTVTLDVTESSVEPAALRSGAPESDDGAAVVDEASDEGTEEQAPLDEAPAVEAPEEEAPDEEEAAEEEAAEEEAAEEEAAEEEAADGEAAEPAPAADNGDANDAGADSTGGETGGAEA